MRSTVSDRSACCSARVACCWCASEGEVAMRPTTLCSPWAWLPPAIALALVVAIHATGANHALFLWLNHGGHVVGDVAWFHLTMLGDGAVALTLMLPSIRRAPGLFWAALVAAMVAALWTQVTKQLIDVPRPLSVF